MKKTFTFALSLFLTSSILNAQNNPCEGGRYVENVFSNTTSTLDIKYGENTSIGGNSIELFADVFEPDGDIETARPLMVLMHGGSFIAGDKSDLHDICEAYASKGYVAATVGYRLYDGPFIPAPDSLDMGEVLIQSVGDVKAAIRYFKEDAATTNTFKIDTNIIIVGGASAGAINALHVAYMDENDDIPTFIETILANNGGLEGNSNNLFQHTSDVHAVISFSGAIYRDHFIDAGEPPVFSVHEEFDDVVPYGDDFAMVGFIPIVRFHGSSLVHARAINEGVSSHLTTYFGVTDHLGYFPDDADILIDSSAYFVASELFCSALTGAEEITDNESIKLYPNPVQNTLWFDSIEPIAAIEAITITGERIAIEFNGNQADVSTLAKGVYFIELKGKNNSILATQKLIKQ